MTANVSFYLIAILAHCVKSHSLQERNVLWNVLFVDHHVKKILYTAISRKVVGKNVCTLQSRKVIWDMINTLFLTQYLSNLLLLLSFSTMASRVILSNFFEQQ